MTQVKLYDTTLRDGMQGQGMSLSAAEKVRIVQALDRLGVQFIEAGFPSSNPKEAELFELLAASRAGAGAGLRVRDDPAARRRRRGRPRAAELAACFAPVCTPGREDLGAPPRQGDQGVARGEPGDDHRLDRASCVRAGKRVVYDAEHFFDGWRDDRAYALECLRAAVAAGAENVTLCDTNGSSLPPQVAEATAAVVEALGERPRSGSTPTTTPSARSPTRSPRSTPARRSSRAP